VFTKNHNGELKFTTSTVQNLALHSAMAVQEVHSFRMKILAKNPDFNSLYKLSLLGVLCQISPTGIPDGPKNEKLNSE